MKCFKKLLHLLQEKTCRINLFYMYSLYKCFENTVKTFFKNDNEKKKFNNLIMFIFFMFYKLIKAFFKLLYKNLYKYIIAQLIILYYCFYILNFFKF